MRNSKVSTVLIMCLLLPAGSGAKDESRTCGLQIHLPREITVKHKYLSLGRVGIIRGEKSLEAKASEIALGQISVPGQKIVIDREMVLSRLACNGIPSWKVKLTGAEKVTVRQEELTISSDRLVKSASSFLEKNPPGASVCQFNPIRIPNDFIVAGTGKNVSLSAELLPSRAANHAKVRITIRSDGQEAGTCEVVFGLKYSRRQAVTKADIPGGAVISHENVKVEKTESSYPEPAGWTAPYGLIARRFIPAKTVIQPNMVRGAKSPVIAKRNQKLVIRIDMPGFLITAVGTAMQEGRAGEYIKVRNVDSKRIILTRINEDGSVTPVF
jgi:flagella basal body P-ring formation protein FlgA